MGLDDFILFHATADRDKRWRSFTKLLGAKRLKRCNLNSQRNYTYAIPQGILTRKI